MTNPKNLLIAPLCLTAIVAASCGKPSAENAAKEEMRSINHIKRINPSMVVKPIALRDLEFADGGKTPRHYVVAFDNEGCGSVYNIRDMHMRMKEERMYETLRDAASPDDGKVRIYFTVHGTKCVDLLWAEKAGDKNPLIYKSK